MRPLTLFFCVVSERRADVPKGAVFFDQLPSQQAKKTENEKQEIKKKKPASSECPSFSRLAIISPPVHMRASHGRVSRVVYFCLGLLWQPLIPSETLPLHWMTPLFRYCLFVSFKHVLSPPSFYVLLFPEPHGSGLLFICIFILISSFRFAL